MELQYTRQHLMVWRNNRKKNGKHKRKHKRSAPPAPHAHKKRRYAAVQPQQEEGYAAAPLTPSSPHFGLLSVLGYRDRSSKRCRSGPGACSRRGQPMEDSLGDV